MIKNASKEVAFNCTYDELFGAIQEIGAFFQIYGYNVDLSKTSGSISFTKNIETNGAFGYIIKVEVYAVRENDQKVVIKAVTSFEFDSNMFTNNVGLDGDIASKYCETIILSARNIIDGKKTLEEDLKELVANKLQADAQSFVNLVKYALIGLLIFGIIIAAIDVLKH